MHPPVQETSTREVVRQVDQLLRLGAATRHESIDAVIEVACETVRETLGYRNVVFNRYRRELDAYEVAWVLGSEDARQALMGTSSPRPDWERSMLVPATQRTPGVFFVTEHDPWLDGVPCFVSGVETPVGADQWSPWDALLVELRSAAGEPLGVLSFDEPFSGLRPGPDEFTLLSSVRAHLCLAIEAAADAERAARQQRDMTHVVTSALTFAEAGDVPTLRRQLAHAVIGLGYGAAEVSWVDDTGPCVVTAGSPVGDGSGLALPVWLAAGLTSGCHVIDAQQGAIAAAETMQQVDEGQIWQHRHRLVGTIIGTHGIPTLLTADHPIDGLTPSHEARAALDLLLQHAQASLVSIEQREHLAFLADHDPLTGLRNRRSLGDLIDGHRQVAVLLCDLDHFKRVNDRFGHETGDAVLRRFADVVRQATAEQGVAVRMGGEEFCVILRDVPLAEAEALAERIRHEVPVAVEDLVDRQTVSIGIAHSGAAPASTRTLIAAADEVLYRAKTSGRNRTLAAESPQHVGPDVRDWPLRRLAG